MFLAGESPTYTALRSPLRARKVKISLYGGETILRVYLAMSL